MNSSRAFSLTENFAKSLRSALTGSADGSSFGEVADVPEQKRVSIDELDDFARRQWEGILGYMVDSSAVPIEGDNQISEPSLGVIELLRVGHLIELTGSSAAGHTPKITKEGFAFVLEDVDVQVWALLFLYVDNAEVFHMSKVAVLSFLFFVSSLELGLAYSSAHLDDTQRRILQDLTEFGIVYQPVSSTDDEVPAEYFYPTRLATALTSDSSHAAFASSNSNLGTALSGGAGSAGAGGNQQKGFIILETNYRVYAYTSSPLQIALLSLFVNPRSRHPNLVTGKMTKKSVQRAVQAGITAEQIISYLTAHAHPQMRRRAAAEHARLQSRSLTMTTTAANPTTTTTNTSGTGTSHTAEAASSSSGNTGTNLRGKQGRPQNAIPVLPATILDQIHLWQLERDRMTTTVGFLLKDFATEREYEEPCRYADEIGVLVWKNDRKRMFFVTRIDAVKDFMSQRRGGGPGGAGTGAAAGPSTAAAGAGG